MPNSKRQSKPPELKVVFDTNAIFTESAAFLVKLEVREIIQGNSSHPDLRISWYLPEVVRWEREFQMRENGFALLPSIGKIEKVLKHNLNITEQTIIERVPLLVDEQLQELGVKIISFEPSDIDWSRMVKDSASRQPPFEKGEKEKGFRDAVILESFLQLVQRSAKTPSSCLIALVARDGRLTTAAKERTLGAKNIRIVEDVSALKGLINTLVAQVDEDFVERIKKEAASYFFKYDENKPDEKSGLIHRENVLQQIASKFSKELNVVPTGYEGTDRQQIFVNDVRFSRKEGRRVYWVTRIEYEYKPYRWQVAEYQGYLTSPGAQGATGPHGPSGPPGFSGFSGAAAYQTILGKVPVSGAQAATGQPANPALESLLRPMMEKSFGTTGRIVFDVTWSAVVSMRHKFSSAQIERIDYVPGA